MRNRGLFIRFSRHNPQQNMSHTLQNHRKTPYCHSTHLLTIPISITVPPQYSGGGRGESISDAAAERYGRSSGVRAGCGGAVRYRGRLSLFPSGNCRRFSARNGYTSHCHGHSTVPWTPLPSIPHSALSSPPPPSPGGIHDSLNCRRPWCRPSAGWERPIGRATPGPSCTA